MRFPRHLKEHGTIGFVAPSFGCSIEPYRTAFENAQKKFKALGHQLDLGPNCYADQGIGISNTPKACGEELTSYYCSPQNDVLISCGGGELMCETLEYTDFEKIRAAEPKWYMGYSDNTNMTFLLATLCDTASIYGPCAAAFGMEPWHESLMDAYHLLRGTTNVVDGYELYETESKKDEEHPLEPYHVTEPRQTVVWLPGEGIRMAAAGAVHPTALAGYRGGERDVSVNLKGRLLGGCLDCLVNLPGTEFDRTADFAEQYQQDGILWFLEACDLNVMAIRRAIWQLKHAGWFAHVKGFLIGRPAQHGQELMGLDQYRAVTDLLAEYEVPILMDLDLGHVAPMMPVVCGSNATVELQGNGVLVKMGK